MAAMATATVTTLARGNIPASARGTPGITLRNPPASRPQVNRVYVCSPNAVAVLGYEKKHSFVIRKEGLPDIVVRNPWENKSKTMVDFGDEEYKQMLCVDAAAVERAITLKPRQEWTGKLEQYVVS